MTIAVDRPQMRRTRGFSGGAQRRPLEAVVRLRPRPSSRHAEDGEAQAPPDGEQPERNDHNHTRPKRARTWQPKRLFVQASAPPRSCALSLRDALPICLALLAIRW